MILITSHELKVEYVPCVSELSSFTLTHACSCVNSGDFRSPATRDQIAQLSENRAADVVVSGM